MNVLLQEKPETKSRAFFIQPVSKTQSLCKDIPAQQTIPIA